MITDIVKMYNIYIYIFRYRKFKSIKKKDEIHYESFFIRKMKEWNDDTMGKNWISNLAKWIINLERINELKWYPMAEKGWQTQQILNCNNFLKK